MSLMGRFARLDSALQRGLDNGFAFVFGGTVVPAEIEELLKQEVEDNLYSTGQDIVGPNVFLVGISRKDLSSLSKESPSLPEDSADRMSRYYRNAGWRPGGPVVVILAEESGLRSGQMRVSSYSAPQPRQRSGFERISDSPPRKDARPPAAVPKPAAPVAPPVPGSPAAEYPPDPRSASESEVMNPYAAGSDDEQSVATEHIPVQAPAQPDDAAEAAVHADEPRVSLLLQDGSSRTYHVREGTNIIGRATDADFRLPDTGVSRQHAEITWDGHDAVLVDLHSTNGTTVNDTPVDNWLLADGDVITLGHSHIEVRITWPSTAYHR